MTARARAITWTILTLLTLTALPGGGGVGAPSVRAATPVAWEHKGFSLPVWSEDGLYASAPALRQLAATGANSVTFVVTWYTASATSTDIYRTALTASDDSLIWAIQQARALGLKVILKPHLDLAGGGWRAQINPPDPDRWFGNYASLINHYADLGRAHGAVALCIGAELITMSTNPAYEGRWRSLIAGVRARFGGRLTYSANWGGEGFAEEFPKLPFWDALDYLGLSAYFNLASTNAPTVEQLKASWADWRARKIAPFQARWGKPVLFIEGGYRSVDGAARRPWESAAGATPDAREQADLYEALFQSWATVPWFAGSAFWHWETTTDVSPTSTGYAVQNKPAFDTVAAWFGGQGGTAPPPTITILNPLTGQTHAGRITVQARAANAARVDYRVNNGPEMAMIYDAAGDQWRASLDTTTLPNGRHHVTVRVTGAGGATSEDTAWDVEIANASTPPLAITILNPLTNQTYSGQITVRARATGAASVRYRVGSGTDVAMAYDAGTGEWRASWDTASVANGRHHVTMTAVGGGGATAEDTAWDVQVANGPPPGPPPPTLATPRLITPANWSSAGTRRPTFGWSAATGATGYRLQVGTDTTFATLLLNEAVTGASYTPVADLPLGRPLTWRVQATAGAATGPWSAPFTVKMPSLPGPALAAPVGGTPRAPIAFSWGAVSGATGYRLQFGPAAGFPGGVTTVTTTGPSHTLPTWQRLQPGVRYSWRVQARNGSGDGLWSATATFTAP